ncbi:MAG: hypothetical protein KF865_04560 [Bdellovibrionaceae bacterium]|nr:hypothetical protein [Pseudobdellovibrionaceae bacterium]
MDQVKGGVDFGAGCEVFGRTGVWKTYGMLPHTRNEFLKGAGMKNRVQMSLAMAIFLI